MSEEDITETQGQTGGELRILSNGAMADVKTGVIRSGAPLDTTQARAMSTLRWEAYRQAAAEGAMRATRRDTPVKAWGYIVEKQAELAIDVEKGRSSTEAARFVRDGMGLTPNNEQQQPAIRIEITGEGLAALAGIVAGGNGSDNYSYTKQGDLPVGAGQGDVIDGEISRAAADE